MAIPIIKHDRIITTQAATLISLFFSDCKLPNGEEQTPESARRGMVDVIASLLDDLGRAENPLLFAKG
jgi:hypothetical protein